ncbi:MAG: type II toxin-antitoxin system RelE family toxin [Candidatus Binatia bacterium]
MRVELSERVVEFVRRLPPDPRRRLRRALRDLARERGDLKSLEGPLEGYCRLRAGAYRIFFSYATRRTIQCVFAERRSIVYELLVEFLESQLIRR